MDTFAYLDEVWSSDLNCMPKTQDDIMSAYVNNVSEECYPPNGLQKTFRPQHPVMEEVNGYDNNQTAHFNIDSYYKNDIQNMQQTENNTDKSIVYCEINEEDNSESYDDKPIYKNVVESYASNPTSAPLLSNELIIFILCGIILIFAMDKLITIGKMMKR